MYLIRVATNSNFGKGHLNRCIKIRNTLKDKVVWFVDKGTKRKLFKSIKDEIIEENSRNSYLKITKYALEHKIKALILDTPEIKKFKKNKVLGKKPIIMFVDEYLTMKFALSICMHPVNIENKNFISGIKYLPIIKKKIVKNNKKKNILVSFGNVDSKCITDKVILSLQQLTESEILNFNEFNVNIILGKYKKNANEIRKMISVNKNFNLFKNLLNLEPMYKKTDFAIGAPGFSQIERAEYNIPTILIAQNSIQKKLLKGWHKSGCALAVENMQKLNGTIISMINSKELKNKIKRKMLKNFDGNGISRITKKIEDYVSNFQS